MNLVEFFKKIGKDFSSFGKKFFAEDQFVEYDNRESLKEAIVRSGMTAQEGSELVQQLDQSGSLGRSLSEKQDSDVIITPADRDGLEQDQTVGNIRNGVYTSGKYNEDEKSVRESGGKERAK